MEEELYNTELVESYDVEILKEVCQNSLTFTYEEFSMCSNYLSANLISIYGILIVGILMGFMFSKAVADGWKS